MSEDNGKCPLDPKQRVRRRMVKGCYIMIVMIFIETSFFIAFGTPAQRENMTAALGLIIAMLGFNTTTVIAWMGLVHHGDINRNKEN